MLLANNINKKRFFSLILSIVIACTAIFTAHTMRFDGNKKIPQRVDAQSLFIPFGGPILYVYECCYGWEVLIQDAVTKTPTYMMYYPGITTLYDYEMIMFTGPNTVGQYFPGGICQTGDECEYEIETAGTMIMVGTSV